jgi:energy-coupling factor transporter ATP-binding protein EcfA2
MLDEPTAGVSPIVMDELFDRIIEVSRTGIPILMVEQNARQALEIADKGYVLVQGAESWRLVRPLSNRAAGLARRHSGGDHSGAGHRPGGVPVPPRQALVAGHLPHRIARRDVFLQRHRALCDRTR